ncbi:MAG: hypothetical protein IKA52_02185 [Bacteroidaceae bacterium]|nr:hypothetical protein [Bacteroidaceae bacterium]
MLKNISLLLISAVLVLTSCNSRIKDIKPEFFTVTPEVLEVVGNEIPVVIDGRFPAKFFNKKSVLTITPILKYENGEAIAVSSTFQGENVRGNDKTISYDNGGNFKLRMAFDYIPAMEDSELYLRFSVHKGNTIYTLPEIKVADGCIATSQLYRQTVATANIAWCEDAFQRVIKQAKEANILFLIQQTNLRMSELKSGEIKEFKNTLEDIAADYENKVLDDVEISSYASPDGDIELNNRLAATRGDNTEKFVKKEIKKAKLEGYVDNRYTAEDWEGFKELVSKSELPDKELILRVLSMYNDPEEREEQIKNISSVYKELADEVLPKLRRARITLNYQLIGRSDTQIKEQYEKDPSILSLEEILYSSILTDDINKQEEIFNTAIKLYPGDYRAYNNLGVMAYNNGDYNTATSYFAKAGNADGTAPEVNINNGYLELMQGNVADAEACITVAASSKAGNEALGNLYLAQGLYGRAASLLEKSNTNSTALAQLLNKEYSTARKTIESIEHPDATTFYIKAVLGARTSNIAFVYDGLKEAIKLDPSLAQKAANDLEFRKYTQDGTFQSITR